MSTHFRYGIWLLDNINFSGTDFTKVIRSQGLDIELLITNFENSKALPEPYQDWIHNRILNHGMTNSCGHPFPINSIYIITRTDYASIDAGQFTLLFKLCLRLVYYSPVLVSHVSEFIENAAITMPGWSCRKSPYATSGREITPDNFDLVIEYFNLLSAKNIRYNNTLEQILSVTEINDDLMELLSLWSFIEGFWNPNAGDSNLNQSLLHMLETDYAPGKRRRDPEIQTITRAISGQNQIIHNDNRYPALRNVLAHGQFLDLEDHWTNAQWDAIREQRNLLVEVVIRSLVNYIHSQP